MLASGTPPRLGISPTMSRSLLNARPEHGSSFVLLRGLALGIENVDGLDLAQRLATIDHPQSRTVGVEPSIDQVAEQRAQDAAGLGGALVQRRTFLLPPNPDISRIDHCASSRLCCGRFRAWAGAMMVIA